MTNPVHAGPVADPMFTDESAACMPGGEHAFVMLLSRDKFAELAHRSSPSHTPSCGTNPRI